MRLFYWTAFWVFLFDQATKYLVVHAMDLRMLGRIDVWPPYLNLRMAWNYGINFGLMAGDNPVTRWVLIAVALVISGAVLWWVHHEPAGRWQKIAAGLLVGGALGNVIDRLIYGAVADFLNMSCCGINNPYAFNVADIAVFVGAFGLVLLPAGKKPS
ncbi:Lipoprotein signal peptidase [Roseovarius tolerans]|uniref:Lipoprotein signal peptidase n=1 Tax=Roseovarius tolerans TaxID=74031 RepID=A0A0L6CWH4_9RHOB|nr:signal peptidase II [Roseovarius tolerans]KNX41843.1 Lipoprotein signal peptidase [Roseovarius tolerans]SEM90438.1 signal peptidase II [Roseovarius tolerans]